MHHKKLPLDAFHSYTDKCPMYHLENSREGIHIWIGNYKNVNNINGHETFINDWRVRPLK